MSPIYPVIMCGGSGTRLWPLSRPERPKPFLPLVGERTLLEATLDRFADRTTFAPPTLVAGEGHLGLVEEQSQDFDGSQVIVEPEGKSTAPAIALAALRLPEEAVLLACPSDLHIADVAAFHAAIVRAAALAADGWLVTFGIAATRPETGYGYVKRGAHLAGGWQVERFVEKPDATKAQAMLDEGGYSWNGGIFAFRAGTFLEELARHRPAMADAVRLAVAEGSEDGARFRPGSEAFAAIAAESVDYAVMEETSRAAMVEADMGWSDIGNWQALRDARQGDGDGNVVRGEAELLDCRKVMVESDGPRVSVVGLEDVIVIVNGDEVLVTSGSGAAKVGKLKGARPA